MDLLSQRYASPFFVLDEMILNGQLYQFNQEIMNIIIEEKKEKYQWEFFLHKVFDRTYEEFLNSIPVQKEQEYFTDEQIKDVVNMSESLLDLF